MQTAYINGTTLAYRDEGAGAPVVLLHAFPLSSAMWEHQIAALAGRFRVIAPDTRGLGASALGDTAVSMDTYADDVAGLLDHLRLARAAVTGLSMGGYIAFALLRRHRPRLAALVLANTRAQADTDEGRRAREESARMAEERGPGAVAEAMLPRLLSPGAPQPLRDEVRRMIEANPAAGIAAAQRAMAARPDSTPLLATIAVPTLVVGAGQDPIIPLEETRAMQAAIPGSRLLELPAAGHLSNLEAPEAFNQALLDFLTNMNLGDSVLSPYGERA
ncbi:MAG TPA: alpha/beta fold hydrolase [Roseiflexaceae bacterium]|nr:alpha/beta fold hydrolase [Roseiflexaceae bacterium]